MNEYSCSQKDGPFCAPFYKYYGHSRALFDKSEGLDPFAFSKLWFQAKTYANQQMTQFLNLSDDKDAFSMGV